ncbi:MAG: flavin-dependent oxidoreductase [Rhizomicrobium sp.]
MKNEIAIVGGGIAGFALALNLHKRGIACSVYEAAPEVREIGVGITLLPHAMRELNLLGVGDDVAALGIANRESAFFNRFGQKIFGEERGRAAGYPYPEIGIHRGKLHGILYREAVARLGSRIRTDHRFKALEQDGDGVTLFLERMSDGSALGAVRAAAVVACDGVKSTIRRQFYPGEGLAFTGINTWRGLTRRKPILDGRTYLRIGSIRTGKMVIYPIADDIDDSGDQLINWVAEITGDGSQQNDWNTPGRREEILPIYDSFKFDWLDVGGLIRDAELVLEYPMVDRDPIARWTFGRVTLAGDAAHPMYPRGSNGSAQALIDARIVADRLAAGDDPAAAFQAYEAERNPATARIVLSNRHNPPDIINLRVEELTGDRPFDALDAFISQEELRELSDNYKRIAGFSEADFNRS